jgi:hypothetical protein
MVLNNIDIRKRFLFQSIPAWIIALILLISPVPVLGLSNSLAQNSPVKRNSLAEWQYPLEQGGIFDRNISLTESPDYLSFVESVWNGQKGHLRGVYVPGVLAIPIVQQPDGNPGFVSPNLGEVTQFSMAAEAGNVGLLAHNYLSGESFTGLTPGQEVRLIYGDGAVEYFVVDHILQYQALEPYNPSSEFRDVETNIIISAEQLFHKVYRGKRHVTFQTCIEAEGNSSWGRLFIVARPKSVSY